MPNVVYTVYDKYEWHTCIHLMFGNLDMLSVIASHNDWILIWITILFLTLNAYGDSISQVSAGLNGVLKIMLISGQMLW